MIERLRVRIPPGEFSSPELTLCADSHSVSVPPPQCHVKDPGHSAKSAGGRLHLNTPTPLTQRSRSGPLSGHSVGNLSGNGLIRNSSGNTKPQSSEIAEPLWTDSCLKSAIGVHDVISTLKKKKGASGE